MLTIQELKPACDKIIAHLEQAFMRLSLWRASTWLVEEMHVHVTSRWMDHKLNQIANISTMDAQTIKIEPRDKAVLKDIEKAIYDANLWFTPQNQGDYIMIKVPPLTTERRKELTKVVSADGEDAKIAIRNKRHDARKHLDHQFADEEISENEKNAGYNQIDEITKKYNEEVERMVKAKSEEVMAV